MPKLSIGEMEEFLTTGSKILKLGTVTAEGYPYVNPLWYSYENDVFLVAEHDTTPQFLVADGSDSSGTNAGANLVSERTGGSNVFGNKFIAENFSTIVPDVDGEGEYFLLENSNGVVHGVGQRLVTDASLDTLDEEKYTNYKGVNGPPVIKKHIQGWPV